MSSSRVTVFATSSVPPGIRGALNQWMLEVLPGIFVGRMNARVRRELWSQLVAGLILIDGAYAALIEPAPTEQGFTFQTVGTHMYEVTDFMGLHLVSKQHNKTSAALLEEITDPNW